MQVLEERASAIHKLRINVKSLTAEARANRLEAKGSKDPEVINSLVLHRTGKLRCEARYAHLSLAFLRNAPYKRVENKVREGNEPDSHYLVKKLNRFARIEDEEVVKWLSQD